MKPTLRNLLASMLLAIAAIGLPGCKSLSKTDSASFASVEVQGHTPEQICAATVVVFQQDGYTAAVIRRSDLVLEKEGSRWDQIAYGSWVNDASVWVRVRVSMVPLSADTFRLGCRSYKVRNKGDALTEEQVRIRNTHSKHYQALLDKVAGQFKR